MAVTEYLRYTVDLNKDTQLQTIENWVTGDKIAHTFELTVLSDGSPANLSGVSCGGQVILPNDDNVGLIGTISGNKVFVPVPE